MQDQKAHLEYLKSKYLELSRQFLKELNEGKSIHLLKGLSSVITTILQEIEALEKSVESQNTTNQP